MFPLPSSLGRSWVSAIAQKGRARFRSASAGARLLAATEEASHRPSDCKYPTHLFIVVS